MTGKVRIIAGRWRGRKLAVPDRPGLRPSGDRVRETLFNWLMPRLAGARCLDLFAGTGALGLEAASRGAARVSFVERDRQLCQALESVAASWPGGEALEVVRADALAWLTGEVGPFDLVFADPPFEADLYDRILDRLARPGILAPDARVYLETPRRAPPPIEAPPEPVLASGPCAAGCERSGPGSWWVVRQKILGEVRMTLLARAADPASL